MAVLTAICAAFALAAQDQPFQPSFRSSANYVRVDAYPTRNGEPVTDLTRDDFAIFDAGRQQTIEHFEHVRVRGGVPQELRREPGSLQGSRAAAQNPRARVFVVFLDTNFVDLSGSFAVRRPVIEALDRLAGPDDVFAVMTPQMSAREMTFSRRTTTFENELTRHWDWGRKDNPKAKDSRDRDCEVTNPARPALVEEAMNRRRERETLRALADLVNHLRAVREERKAVIAITQGWVLYGPNPALGALREACGRDVTMIDHKREFLRLVGEANRANASFYPIDPRGLAVFEQSITRPLTPGPGLPLAGFQNAQTPETDTANLQARRSSLRSLADGTDGLAMIDSNDLSRSFKRIVDDLSSYYLLGYYSNVKPDGRFHALKVHVRRPGVQVRARAGYLADDPALVTSAVRSEAVAPGPAAAAAAVAHLATRERSSPLRLDVAAGWTPGNSPAEVVWVTGELGTALEAAPLRKHGATAWIDLAGPEGESAAGASAALAPGTRSFAVALSPVRPLSPGEYVVRATVRGADSDTPVRERFGFHLPPSPGAVGARWARRGPSTANRDVPTADLRFRRGERLTVQVLTHGSTGARARLLDREGRPLPMPIAAASRDDPDGSRWLSAEVPIAPLAPGDYVIELQDAASRTLAAFRVIP